jgi:hypothetical protein
LFFGIGQSSVPKCCGFTSRVSSASRMSALMSFSVIVFLATEVRAEDRAARAARSAATRAASEID